MAAGGTKIISPGQVYGHLEAPPSKSMAQRAIAIAALIEGASNIRMGTPCDDINAAIRAAQALGAHTQLTDRSLVVSGHTLDKQREIDCGEAGLTLRMFCAAAALFDSTSVLNVSGSLRNRPANMVVVPLVSLGAKCETRDGNPPITVTGPIRGGQVEVDGSTSSQFLTGLLIALMFCREDSTILAPGLKSIPYVQMTVDLLSELGGIIEVSKDYDRFFVAGGQNLIPFYYRVPGDWSGASFLVVAGALRGEVRITGIDPLSPQADQRILEAAQMAGASITTGPDWVHVKSRPLKSFSFDATHCPDLFPPLVALAVHCNGTSRIKGVHRLTSKESNRELALLSEFGKLDAQISVAEDEMVVVGGTLKGGQVVSHGDHRIAMGVGVAAIGATDDVKIEGYQSVNKSYPDFFDDMKGIGLVVK